MKRYLKTVTTSMFNPFTNLLTTVCLTKDTKNNIIYIKYRKRKRFRLNLPLY